MDVRCPNCAGLRVTKVWADKSVLTFACAECGEEFDVECEPEELNEADRSCESMPFCESDGISAELMETDGMWLVELLREGEHAGSCWFGSKEDAVEAVDSARGAYFGIAPGAVFTSLTTGQAMTVSSVGEGSVSFSEGGIADMDRAAFALMVGSGELICEKAPMRIQGGMVFRNGKGVTMRVLSTEGNDALVEVTEPGNSVSVAEQAWKVDALTSLLGTGAYGYELVDEKEI